MSLKFLHLLRPQEALFPGINGWLQEAMLAMGAVPKWDGCTVIRDITYDVRGAFNAQSCADKVAAQFGPVVLLESVQTPARLDLVRRIGTRTVVLARHVHDQHSLLAAFDEAHDLFVAGEPRLQRFLVVALLLVKKLEREHMWGGKNKGYKWASDLPTGRRMNAKFSSVVPQVLGWLLSNDVLIKKVSQGSNKYALNPNRKPQIYQAIRLRSFESFLDLHRVLIRDTETASVRELDSLNDPT